MERASPASAAVPTTLEVCPAADAIVFSGEAPHRTERGKEEEEKGVPSRFPFAGPKIGFSSSFPLSPLFAFPQGEVAAGFGGCAFKNAVSAHDVQNEEARREEEEEEKEEEEEMEAFGDEERREGSTWTHTCGGAEEEPKGGAAVRSPQSGTGVAARCPSPRSSPVVCEEESSVEERQEVVECVVTVLGGLSLASSHPCVFFCVALPCVVGVGMALVRVWRGGEEEK